MKKTIFILLVGLISLLCGCTDKKTKEIVLDTYEAYWQMRYDVFFQWPQMAEPNQDMQAQEIPGYSIVDDERYRSVEDIMQTIEKVCTKNEEEQLKAIYFRPESELFIEQEGTLYRRWAEDFMFARYQDRKVVKMQIVKQNENYIHAKFEFPYGEEDLSATAYIEMELVLEDSVWKVDSYKRTNEIGNE